MANLLGQTLLDQFYVEAFVASGGMGTVYKVWDTRRNVHLAMKVLHADLAEDQSALERFGREARALQKLAHPHIVPFYGLFHTLDLAFLIERYIDGPTLKEILRQRRSTSLPIDETLSYLKAITSALGYAHAHGVVHCDIKPGNVMVDQGGTIYLTDFGVARHADSMATTLGFAGTAAYMAPEQCRAEPVTPQTDVYALGVMAYEMLTGRRPFRGDERQTERAGTAAERVRHAHMHLPPPDPLQFNPDLPRPLADAILKALAKHPPDRFPDAQAFFQALSTAARITPSDLTDRAAIVERDRPFSTSPAPTARVPQKDLLSTLREKPWLLVAAAAGFVAVLILTFSLLGGPAPTREGVGSTTEEQTREDVGVMLTQAANTVEAVMQQATEAAGLVIQPATTQRAKSTAWVQPTKTHTPTKPPSGSLWRPVPGCPMSRLRVGDWTRVTLYPAVCNRLRNQPNTETSDILACIDPGGVLRVISGPTCREGWLWWEVRTEQGAYTGWMAEGNGDAFWVDAGSATAP